MKQVMTFEESYKFAHEVAGVFVDEEEVEAKSQGTSIYDADNHVNTLLNYPYSNMFTKTSEVEVRKIFTNPIREQTLKRVRSKLLAVASLTGYKFVEQLTTNLIDEISAIGKHYTAPRVSRKRLTELFEDIPCLWFCIVASTIYNNRLVVASNERIKKKASPGTERSTRTASASLL